MKKIKVEDIKQCDACFQLYKDNICPECREDMAIHLDKLELLRIVEDRGFDWVMNTLLKGRGSNNNWTS